ncbi:MFS transporter [Streptomyces purpurogeneiscleroticus]|uniref:MFS transporter n=1 Tax=Streptomyces purpurogeneiscleroticus TaxID=68259 RepID=UPI001CBDF32E|nr:MFS transporter [Streptomyces purpurogeneiscleroticus]
MRKGQLGFLAGTHAVNDLYQGAVPALLPFLMSQRHYSYAAVSGIALAVAGISSVLQPFFGVLADRKPRPWLVPAGFTTAAVGVAAAGLVDNYWATWVCVAAAGVGIGAYHPPATSQARQAGGQSQKAMSVFALGGTLGASLAPTLVTLVVGGLGLSASWLLAAPALAMAALWLAKKDWSRPAARPVATAAAAGAPRAKDDWRAFARLVAVMVLWSIPYVTVTAMISLYARSDLHASTAQAAAALTTFTLSGAAGTLLGGWAADRFGRLVPVRTGYVLGAVALAGITWAPSLPVLLICAGLCGTALFLPFAPQVTLGQDYLPTRPGTASGLTLGLAMSVGGLSSPLFGRLADAHGLRPVFIVVFGASLVAVACSFLLPDPKPRTAPPVPRQAGPERETTRA